MTTRKIELIPSKQTTLIDLPEIDDLKSSFVYSFFEPDERVNNPTVSDSRFIKLTWTPNVVYNRRDLIESVLVEQNYDKIIYEDQFNNDTFKVVDLNSSSGQQQDVYNLLLSSFNLSSGSLLDTTKRVYENTHEEINQEFIGDVIQSQKKNLGVYFDNDNSGNIRNENILFPVAMSTKFIDKLLETIDENNIGFSQFLSDQEKEQIKNLAAEAKEKQNSNMVSIEDYDHELANIFSVRSIKTDSTYQPIFQPVGYVIEKFNQTTQQFEQPIFIEDIIISGFNDSNVKYDQTYVYRIRTVAYLEFLGINSETNEYLVFSFLVGSRLSNSTTTECIETLPPPVVSDFDVSWDYVKQLPKISWSFPPNKQRDIKKFQVFRRESIEHPFELIKQFDFDNSVIKTISREQPNSEVVEILPNNNPVLFHWDKQFNKTSRQIYSVCSVDAHGYSSGYSLQLEVGWVSNKFTKKFISVSGAPKAYPNLFLNQDAFVDSMKTEEFDTLDLYFNPEFIHLVDKQGRSLEFLKTETNDTYSLVMINIDNQKQTQFEINLRTREN